MRKNYIFGYMMKIKHFWNDVLSIFRYERVHDEELLTLKKFKFYFLFKSTFLSNSIRKILSLKDENYEVMTLFEI